jgi:hypothetical protein
MTQAQNDKWLQRVRALLAKAEDPGATTEEAEAFTAKAAELMAKYGINRAILAASHPTSDTITDRIIVCQAPYAIDRAVLLAHIAAALRCRTIRRKQYNGSAYEYRVHLIGYGSDLERVEMLYTSLLIQSHTGMARAQPDYNEPLAAFRRSWLQGFTWAISQRLAQAEAHAAKQAAAEQTGGTSVALVLVTRTDLVNQRTQAAYPKLTNARPRRLTGSGRERGYAAGEQADLGQTRVTRRGPNALG